MDDVTKKKLNLLTHLAKIDGDFHKSEQRLINEIIEQRGFKKEDFHLLDDNVDAMAMAHEDLHEKEELLFLALKLIQADSIIDDAEVEFCQELASKLGYKPDVIDHFAHKSLPSREEFDKELDNWKA